MKLRLILSLPISGYWDGGMKSQFDFEIESWRPIGHDKDGEFVRIGCWDANNWFHVAWSGTEKKTLANVKRKMNNKLKRAGIPFTWKYLNC